MSKPKVAGKSASEHLMQKIRYKQGSNLYAPMPSEKQVALVLHALADHTAILAMTNYDRMGKAPQGEDPAKETKFWATETSIGRWFQAVADDLERQ